ncbi:hypothetical protein VNO77_18937 [Canavalia gladiata]|uniref:Uncharacterized protein n=1 Tax=Canavalia gladiata TaxID=3824 RepID=A0AAN9QKV7_CANGL
MEIAAQCPPEEPDPLLFVSSRISLFSVGRRSKISFQRSSTRHSVTGILGKILGTQTKPIEANPLTTEPTNAWADFESLKVRSFDGRGIMKTCRIFLLAYTSDACISLLPAVERYVPQPLELSFFLSKSRDSLLRPDPNRQWLPPKSLGAKCAGQRKCSGD